MSSQTGRIESPRRGLRILSWSLLGVGVAALVATCSEPDAKVEPSVELTAVDGSPDANVGGKDGLGGPVGGETESQAKAEAVVADEGGEQEEEIPEEEPADEIGMAAGPAPVGAGSGRRSRPQWRSAAGSPPPAPPRAQPSVMMPRSASRMRGVPGGVVGGMVSSEAQAMHVVPTGLAASSRRHKRKSGVDMDGLPTWTHDKKFETPPSPWEAKSKHDRSQVESKRRRPLVEEAPMARRQYDPRAQAWRDHIVSVREDRKSTFSIDVDTAAYARARKNIEQGTLPGWHEVRVEEMINYFDYDYPAPDGDAPIAIYTELGPSPWNKDTKLVHVGLQAKEVAQAKVPARNLVFLLDVSGSMSSEDRLPLLARGLSLMVPSLREQDRVSIVVYAGAAGMVLPPTSGDRGAEILMALDKLEAGGSTNGGEGIELAYKLARDSFVDGGINRVILATDGDFNVGLTDRGDLIDLISRQRKTGVYLSVLGFGVQSSEDSAMEQLADKGNGNYAYIDSVAEAHKVLVTEGGSTIVPVADDVKIQVEFDDRVVESYRLIGYDNRRLAHADFADDRKDAGEMGSGHTVTALYEVQLRDEAKSDDEVMTVDVRYKDPGVTRSELLQARVRGSDRSLSDTTDAFRFAAAVAQYGQLLSGYELPDGGWPQVVRMAQNAREFDEHCHRAQFVDLAAKAATIDGHAAFASHGETECTVGERRSSRTVATERDEHDDGNEHALSLPAMDTVVAGTVDEGFGPFRWAAAGLEMVASVLRAVPTGLALALAMAGTVLLGLARRRDGL